jgi:hypothetical protein
VKLHAVAVAALAAASTFGAPRLACTPPHPCPGIVIRVTWPHTNPGCNIQPGQEYDIVFPPGTPTLALGAYGCTLHWTGRYWLGQRCDY